MLFSVILLSAGLGLAAARPKPTSTTPTATTCSPSVSSGLSFVNSDQLELGINIPLDDFNILFWVPAVSTGPWNFVKSGDFFAIEHELGPGLALTADEVGSNAQVQAGPAARQQWNITCTECPSSGLANNRTFSNANDKIDGVAPSSACIFSGVLGELGNQVFVDDCKVQTGGGINLTINYHQ
ncbi:hypothetical protein C8F04DRAFT_1388325 [Mycena alexandri]|uniref:Uncharacterized protein n=1 Tax=Mycena alexandri TaxID=1745969 RepID=A0AAD6XD99_9AGAR|nr:hypothetical protein C8F04DRAFT_1388325 [Mycena alexandri]